MICLERDEKTTVSRVNTGSVSRETPVRQGWANMDIVDRIDTRTEDKRDPPPRNELLRTFGHFWVILST